MTVAPEIRYAKTEEGYVGYRVFGQGPFDVLFIGNWASNIELMWEHPAMVRFLGSLGEFARVIIFDKRGAGVSDPVPLGALPTLEQWMDDARVVMDAADSDRPALIGDAEGGPMARLFAATYPSAHRRAGARQHIRSDSERRGLRDRDAAHAAENLLAIWEPGWGTGSVLQLTAPSVADDPRMQQWVGRYMRQSAPKLASARFYRWVVNIDVRPVLPSIQAPTLVMHRAENPLYRPPVGRYLADHISGAKYVELAGADWYPPFVNAGAALDAIQEFLTGARPAANQNRILATVLFTDIVGSTQRAAALGDQGWLDLLDAHHRLARAHLERCRGGFVGLFDGPARAVRCAAELALAVRSLGLEIRAGLHAGEIEAQGGRIGGIAVNIAARVMGAAPDGRVLVSQTVKDLVVGSGIEFTDRGSHSLKGVPDKWRLYEVDALP